MRLRNSLRATRRLAWIALAVSAWGASASAQSIEDSRRNPGASLRALDGSQLASLSLSQGRLIEESLPERIDTPFELVLPLDGVTHTLRLAPASLRSADFQLLVSDGAGGLVPALAPPTRVVRGELDGVPGSAAAGALVDGELRLVLRAAPDAPAWGIDALPDGGHALYPLSAVVGEEGACGAFAPHVGAPSNMLPPSAGASEALLAELAIDADFEYFELNGSSVPATVADIEAVLAATELIYSADVTVEYSLTSLTVQTDAADAYTSSDPEGLLIEFRNHWNATQGAVLRDLAHLFTGRNLDGSTVGIAYVGVVCHGSAHYGLSQSHFSSNFTRRVALTAHELGHNWSAGHCNGDPDCAIMCSGVGGCSGEMEQFGAASLVSIEQEKAAANCLEPAVPINAPVLESLSPTFGPASGGTALDLHGSQFPTDPAPSVTFGGLPATLLSASDDLLQVSVPAGAAGSEVDVRVSGVTGSSQLDQAFHYAAEVVGGDKVQGELDSGDVEPLLFDAPAGARLSARLVPLDITQGLLPGLRLIGPGEEQLTQLDAAPAGAGKPLGFKLFELPSSGSYRLEAYGQGGSAGAYKLLTKLKLQKAHTQTLAVSAAEATPTFTFSAAAGSTLKLARFKALKAKGDFAEIDGQPAALVPDLLSLTGPDGAIALGEFLETAKNGSWIRVRKLPLPSLGDYTLTVGGQEASAGYGKLRVKLKPPPKSKSLHLLED